MQPIITYNSYTLIKSCLKERPKSHVMSSLENVHLSKYIIIKVRDQEIESIYYRNI